jgi:ribose-phosphate pyrophosphokinase
MPFYAYARSDKKDKPRVPITARLVADMVCTAGASRFMTVDLHAGQIQGFFDIPGDELTVFPLLSAYIAGLKIPNLVVVAADLGFAKKARNLAEELHAPVAFVEKRRQGRKTDSLAVIGDVRERNVLIVDDEVDVGGTMCGAAGILHKAGALDIHGCFVHPTFSGPAVTNLGKAEFKGLVCTNTEPITTAVRARLPNLRVIHLGDWLGRMIGAVHRGESVAAAISSYQPDMARVSE